MDEALQLVHAPEKETGGIEGLLAPDGRVAYSVPLPKHWRRHDPSRKKPSVDDSKCDHDAWVRKTQRYIRASFFFLPPLPPVSVRYYNELTHQERGEVDALRRYWISLRMFKDRLRVSRVVVAMLVGLPILLLLGVWATGLERVPLTGRWRLILLTPEEEDVVATSLEGANWYKSVINLLTTPEKPAPPVLPFSDWRWQWVQSTLRHIEASMIAAAERTEQGLPRPADAPDLYPPKPSYPLRPRPRVSARLHAALPGSDAMSGLEHMELGPPYNILIMDSPDKNAFSYGFGGKGAGGIVIFTGLLDEIMKHNNAPPPPEPAPQSGGLFGGLFSTTPRRVNAPPQPTEEQTLHLAMVLSHEMGHLLLSHHLETLSHQQVLWPSILNFSIDLLRACIWPFTIFLGPTVNDALANVGRTSAEEMSQRLGHVGFEYKHEYEADLSGLRLLAHAGYNPRSAVDEYASSVTHLEEIEKATLPWWSLFKLWASSHPSPDERVKAMRDELDRWVREAQKEKEGSPVKGGNEGAWRAE
ncbi:hypothetical protein Q8F55_002420 [Vanrija albida]|uniref:Peptidase M48 domain-containing protein n=1 Tax=Vanrija albida TaxID=181172 RepID=A0ABR3Q9S6_9TREE